MKLLIASDHNAIHIRDDIYLELSEKYSVGVIKDYVLEKNCNEIALRFCDILLNRNYDLGIILCKTGIGMSIACNKIKNIRCGLCKTEEDAINCRKTNNANVLAAGVDISMEIIEKFIETKFTNEPNQIARLTEINKLGS